MKKLAKHEQLNWQAILIEETQTELKALIKDLILTGKSKYEIAQSVLKKIKNCIDELESPTLKFTAERSLALYAQRVYNILNELFAGFTFIGLTALVAVSKGKATPKQYRQALKMKLDNAYNIAQPLEIYAKDYMDIVKQRLDYLSKLEAKEDYSSRVTLRNIAEMQVRQERHEQELQDLIDNGHDLVWIVPHANCSKRCEPFQGKLYSISGKSGIIDGIRYQPLSEATDVYEVTKAGKIYKNGCLSGFNCRHTLQAYNKGNRPIEIPARVINRQREINNKQRYLERGIRHWKDRALLFKDIDKSQYLFSYRKAKEWNKKYIEFSKTNNVPYYPSRTDVF